MGLTAVNMKFRQKQVHCCKRAQSPAKSAGRVGEKKYHDSHAGKICGTEMVRMA